MRLLQYVAFMGRLRIHTKLYLENLKGQDHLRDLGEDGRIILKCIL
jgi:hypothetical protein